MKNEECFNILDDLLMDAWEWRDHVLKIAKNESWVVIHDAPKELVDKAVNIALKTCHQFTSRVNTNMALFKMGVIVDLNDLVEFYTKQLACNINQYKEVLEEIGEHAIVRTPKPPFRKSYVRE